MLSIAVFSTGFFPIVSTVRKMYFFGKSRSKLERNWETEASMYQDVQKLWGRKNPPIDITSNEFFY